VVCPYCGHDNMSTWSQDTVHGEASGWYCEECEERCGDGQREDSPTVYEWKGHIYGASRSGKTCYATPVLVLGRSATRPETHTRVRTFLFWPDEKYPQGQLNSEMDVWTERIIPYEGLMNGHMLEDRCRVMPAREPKFIAALKAIAELTEIPPSTDRAKEEGYTR
jgi:hypothetical protein